jgi:hypothetical protein
MAGRGPSPRALSAERKRQAAAEAAVQDPNGAPDAPADLQDAGRDLWCSIQGRWKLDPRESAVLLRCCRLADVEQRLFEELADVDVVVHGSTGQPREHPLLNRYVQTNLAVGRLLATLSLAGGELVSLTSQRAGNAGAARWAAHNRVKAQREALGVG